MISEKCFACLLGSAIVTGFSQPPNSPNLANSANPSSTTMVLHILTIHRPNFGENGRNFEVVMNRQTFLRAKRVEERKGERNKD